MRAEQGQVPIILTEPQVGSLDITITRLTLPEEEQETEAVPAALQETELIQLLLEIMEEMAPRMQLLQEVEVELRLETLRTEQAVPMVHRPTAEAVPAEAEAAEAVEQLMLTVLTVCIPAVVEAARGVTQEQPSK